MCPGCKTASCKALTVLPDDFSAIYRCPGCARFYADRDVAIACSNSNEKVNFKPGDIVRIDVGYSWYDGAKHWLILNTGEHHGRPTHSAYFVVTAITHERHVARYSVKTLGIKNGNPTGLCGGKGKGYLKIVKKPDRRLVEESKPFIGEVYENYL